jgi:uncharacterized protein (DUF1697 family)
VTTRFHPVAPTFALGQYRRAVSRFAIFLRGVNVGGRTMRMTDVRRVLTDAGLQDVSTLLASGNVVCRLDGDAPQVKALAEGALRAGFGYEAWVVVLPAERLAELVDACPYPPDSAERHCYISLSSDPAVLDEITQAVAAAAPDLPQTRLGPEAVAWTVPVGRSLEWPWAAVAGKARYKPSLTERNLRTMLKVRTALESLPQD